jgi:AbrB family looped-hinge helix DNA binding protein
MVTVSQKGWVVIPVALRDNYHWNTGDRVKVVDYGGVVSLVRHSPRRRRKHHRPVRQAPLPAVADGLPLIRVERVEAKRLLQDRRARRVEQALDELAHSEPRPLASVEHVLGDVSSPSDALPKVLAARSCAPDVHPIQMQAGVAAHRTDAVGADGRARRPRPSFVQPGVKPGEPLGAPIHPKRRSLPITSCPAGKVMTS